jgi:aminoglycoside phosphotransferase (APT) family kinase protein
MVTDEVERYLSGDVASAPRSPLPPVLSHADLKGEHIIVSERADAVAGVIDWSDATITDPLLDFAGLAIWLGGGFVRQVLAHYTRPADGAFLERVRFYARCFTLDRLGWYLTNRFDAPLELLKTQARWAFAPER